MGISGLLPCLRSIEESCSVKSLKGMKVGVDSYCWLHKLCRSSAAELATGERVLGYLTAMVKKVRELVDQGVDVVMVFDGADLPLKEGTNIQRRAKRKRSLDKAKVLRETGRVQEANSEYQLALEITTDIAQSTIRILKHMGVTCLVAPYEADAQLAYLATTKQIDYVITEDSDLIAYLTPKIIYKLDWHGNGVLLRTNRLPEVESLNFSRFTKEMLLTNFILAGCDYLPSLHGIGVKKANKIVAEHRDVAKILSSLQADTKLSAQDDVSQYTHRFLKAFFAFRHHIVYDPRVKKCRYYNDLAIEDTGIDAAWVTATIGSVWSDELAEKICGECVLDPVTHVAYDEDGPALKNAKLFLEKLRPRGVAVAVKQPVLKKADFQPPKKKVVVSEVVKVEVEVVEQKRTTHRRVVETAFFKEDSKKQRAWKTPQTLDDFLTGGSPEELLGETDVEKFLEKCSGSPCPHGLCTVSHSLYHNCKVSVLKRPYPAPTPCAPATSTDIDCLFTAVRRRVVTTTTALVPHPSPSAITSLTRGGGEEKHHFVHRKSPISTSALDTLSAFSKKG